MAEVAETTETPIIPTDAVDGTETDSAEGTTEE